MAKMNYKQLKGIEDIHFKTDGSIIIKLNQKETNVQTEIQNEVEFSKERLSQVETALMFDVTIQTVINWSRKGLIKRYKIGNRVFYLKSELLNAAQVNHTLQKI